MKRLAFLSCAVLFLSLAVYAQDVSLDLITDATVSRLADTDFTLYEKIVPAFYVPLGTQAEIAGSGYVKAAWTTAGRVPPCVYELDLLRYELALKDPSSGMKSFVFDAGRFAVSDPGSYVLSSPADGVSFAFNYPAFHVSFRSAYTGLLFRDASEIVMSLADTSRVFTGRDITASPRFLNQAEITLPRFFDQALTFSVLVQNDLNPENRLLKEGSTSYTVGKGGKFNTQYFELKSSGSVSSVAYSAFITYGSGSTLSWIADADAVSGSYQYKPISSVLAGAWMSVPLSLPQPFTGTSAGARFLIASGDKDASSPREGNTSGDYTAFTSLNTPTLAAVFSPDLTNIMLGEISFASSIPVSNFRLDGSAKILAFFRPTAGPISEPGIDPGSTSPYVGTEVDFTIAGRILSDVAVSFIGGVFVPGNAFAPANRVIQYSAGITVTLSM